jgi:hypothetical protein
MDLFADMLQSLSKYLESNDASQLDLDIATAAAEYQTISEDYFATMAFLGMLLELSP